MKSTDRGGPLCGSYWVRSALLGAVVGLVATLWLRSLLEKLLFGISGVDSAALVFAALALSLRAFAAGIVPAWRAAATDPARALQSR